MPGGLVVNLNASHESSNGCYCGCTYGRITK